MFSCNNSPFILHIDYMKLPVDDFAFAGFVPELTTEEAFKWLMRKGQRLHGKTDGRD